MRCSQLRGSSLQSERYQRCKASKTVGGRKKRELNWCDHKCRRHCSSSGEVPSRNNILISRKNKRLFNNCATYQNSQARLNISSAFRTQGCETRTHTLATERLRTPRTLTTPNTPLLNTSGFSPRSSPPPAAPPAGHPDSELCAASACHTTVCPGCIVPNSASPAHKSRREPSQSYNTAQENSVSH